MNSVPWPTIKKGRRPLLGNGQRPDGLGRLLADPPADLGGSLWGLTARQDLRSTLGGSARRRLGWLKRQVTGAIAHGPAGIPNLTIFATVWAPSGLESNVMIKAVNDRGGPSPFGERFAFAPANASHRALFQSDEGHTKAL